jgi:alkanesulfonate monooxygenase SsuD/methylene tetrahydromethanopterin reductase-like flavin-dependent oxidoreductase (luciferase family)
MDFCIHLPTAIPGVDAPTLLDWARRVEEYPFATVSALDRLVFPNYEPLVMLATVAALTTRVRLMTAVLLAPVRLNTALLAKQLATLDSLSGGRLVLGVGVGNRTNDFDASGADFHSRGRSLERQLGEMRRIWSAASGREPGIGPAPAQLGGPPVLIGGGSDAAIRRVARLGDGWISGGGGPDEFARYAGKVRAAWAEAGRGGSPRLLAVVRFALGPGAREKAEASHSAYYTFRPSPRGDPMGGALLTVDAIQQAVAVYEAAGCDELILSPAAADLTQLEQLARALF